MKALIVAVMTMACMGCSTALKPLGEPTTQIINSQTTLEFSQPVFDRYECPKHGYLYGVKMIAEKPYCIECLWERILGELK